jgi:hypothetical protein
MPKKYDCILQVLVRANSDNSATWRCGSVAELRVIYPAVTMQLGLLTRVRQSSCTQQHYLTGIRSVGLLGMPPGMRSTEERRHTHRAVAGTSPSAAYCAGLMASLQALSCVASTGVVRMIRPTREDTNILREPAHCLLDTSKVLQGTHVKAEKYTFIKASNKQSHHIKVPNKQTESSHKGA